MPPDDPCQPIQDELDAMDQEITSLSELLSGASGPEKADLLKKMKDLMRLEAPKQRELAQCREKNPLPVDPAMLWATLTGTATLRTDDNRFPGPFFESVSFGLSGSAFKRMKQTANNLHHHRSGKFPKSPTPLEEA
jgi:hypothetical protein